MIVFKLEFVSLTKLWLLELDEKGSIFPFHEVFSFFKEKFFCIESIGFNGLKTCDVVCMAASIKKKIEENETLQELDDHLWMEKEKTREWTL